MEMNREQMWQAYIDGELSTSEMAGFEGSLNPVEQQQLARDVQFERGLSERLAAEADCPDDVWERTKALLLDKAAAEETVVPFKKRRPRRHSVLYGAGSLVAAAVLAFTTTMLGGSTNSAPIFLHAATIDDLAKRSVVEANLEAIQAFMHENNIHLDLLPENSISMAKIHTPIQLVGASKDDASDCVELFAGCCRQPVKILIVHRDSEAAKLIGQATNSECDVQATRIVGDYLTAVVGRHPAHDLLDIFAGQHP